MTPYDKVSDFLDRQHFELLRTARTSGDEALRAFALELDDAAYRTRELERRADALTAVAMELGCTVKNAHGDEYLHDESVDEVSDVAATAKAAADDLAALGKDLVDDSGATFETIVDVLDDLGFALTGDSEARHLRRLEERAKELGDECKQYLDDCEDAQSEAETLRGKLGDVAVALGLDRDADNDSIFARIRDLRAEEKPGVAEIAKENDELRTRLAAFARLADFLDVDFNPDAVTRAVERLCTVSNCFNAIAHKLKTPSHPPGDVVDAFEAVLDAPERSADLEVDRLREELTKKASRIDAALALLFLEASPAVRAALEVEGRKAAADALGREAGYYGDGVEPALLAGGRPRCSCGSVDDPDGRFHQCADSDEAAP